MFNVITLSVKDYSFDPVSGKSKDYSFDPGSGQSKDHSFDPGSGQSKDYSFDPGSGQSKDYEIGICCFSAKHAALRSKSKDWLALNEDNMSEWRDMSTSKLFFQ